MTESDLTPLMLQYREIKRTYQEAIVFFRVGDFYEMFFEDAEEASSILNIALTSREKTSAHPVPLCGVPYHAAGGYISKLLKTGRTVALCEQVEDPKLAKGLVRREVVRLYTPGTLFDAELLESKESSFLAAVCCSEPTPTQGRQFGLAILDLSTGEFSISEFSGRHAQEATIDELIRVAPQELIFPDGSEGLPPEFRELMAGLKFPRVAGQDPSWFDWENCSHLLQKQFQTASLKDLGVQTLTVSVQAAGAILQYLRETQPTISHHHVQRPHVRRPDREMLLDSMTIRNLELIHPLLEGQDCATLLSVLDRTVTPMGSRLLRQWIIRPLVEVTPIQARLDAVSEFTRNLPMRSGLRTTFKLVQDLERLTSRVSMATASPRELLALKQSLQTLPKVWSFLESVQCPFLKNLCAAWDNLDDIRALIENSILPDAPHSMREGGIIRDGYDPQLDSLCQAARDGMKLIADLENRERRRTGIESLKVKFNQVFGYYFEVTKTKLGRVPEDFIRKQTLANAERFTTEELQRLEDQVTGANLKLRSLEQDLFSRIRQQVAKETVRTQTMARRLATLDVITAFAEAAALNRYVCPEIDERGTISILDGRHPVVERMNLPGGFIPNDTYLDLDTNRLLLITGPNMAGKSTYLRQTGLIVFMAHLGSFVPASKAQIGLVDRIFTRVGASDNLAAGQSTFMVEMTETARLLEAATPRSLILLDEIGRGTSTYDGLSIAWAVAEFIQDRTQLGARTLFATHFHEMTRLESLRGGVKNYTVSVKEENETIIFLRKIVQGKSDRSYGIHVATLAGLPLQIIHRAKEVLNQLERSESSEPTPIDNCPEASDPTLPEPHPIIQEMKQMDLFSMTPLEALNRLADLQRRLDSE